jgi:hypothetical protein
MPKRHPVYRSTFTLHRIGIHDPDAEIYGPEYEAMVDRSAPDANK